MNKACILATALALLIVVPFFGVVFADANVAVKKGDWMEYQVTVAGEPAPIHNITWARLDVTDVEGSVVGIDFQTKFANGTLWVEPNITLNVAVGSIGEGCIIPTNLMVGDVYQSEYEGNITVTSTQDFQVGGAQRTVLCGISNTVNRTTYMWDKQTGVMVQATTSLPDCTVYTKTSGTNLWQPKVFELDAELFYALITMVVVAGVVVVLGLVWRKKPMKTVA
jgi:hypothetical protein